MLLVASITVITNPGGQVVRAIENVSVVLDAVVVTCETDPTLNGPDDPLYYDGTLPLPNAPGVDDTPGVQPAWVGTPIEQLCNNHIAALDEGSVGLAVSVNPDPDNDDPTDGNPPPVTNLTLQATISNGSWLPGLPSICGAGSSITPNGQTLTCVIPGPVDVGEVILIPARYTAGSHPDGTPLDINLTTTATQVQPPVEPDNGPLLDPPEASDAHQVIIDSWVPPINVGKTLTYSNPASSPSPGAGVQRFDDNGDGTWDRVRITWDVHVGPDMLEAHAVLGAGGKGVAPITLEDFMFVDDASFGGLYPSATLVSCTSVSSTSSSVAPPSDWTCEQPGGAGAPIEMSLPDGEYRPLDRCSSGHYSTGGYIADRTWCAGEVPQAGGTDRYRDFAINRFVIEYDAADLYAVDQTANDFPTPYNLSGNVSTETELVVGVCNTVPTEQVMNAGVPADNADDDQTMCRPVDLRPTAPGVGRDFHHLGFYGGRNGMHGTGHPNGVGDAAYAAGVPYWGSPVSTSEDRVMPGQHFFQNALYQLRDDHGIEDQAANTPFLCVAWDPGEAPLAPMSGLTQADEERDWVAVTTVGNAPDASTVVVEFGVVSQTYDGSNPRGEPIGCDDDDGAWLTDPTSLPGGATAVNVYRVSTTESWGADGVHSQVNTAIRRDVPPGAAGGDTITAYAVRSFNGADWSLPPNTNLDTATNPAPVPWATHNQRTWDRAVVSAAETMVTIDGAGQTPLLPVPSSDAEAGDTVTDLFAGGTWDAEVRPYLITPQGPGPVENVRVSVVFPPGVSFNSSSMPPASAHLDCAAAFDNNCIDDPSLDPNVGWTTVVWDLGTQLSTGEFTALDPITLSTDISAAMPGGAVRVLYAWSAYGDQPTINTSSQPLSGGLRASLMLDRGMGNTSGGWGGFFNWNYTGVHGGGDGYVYVGSSSIPDHRWDPTAIRISNPAALAVDKRSLDPVVPVEDEFTHRIEFIQQAGGSRDVDIIDVFPYNGDGRLTDDQEGSLLPSSSTFNGSLELVGIAVSVGDAVDLDTVWVSSANPATIQRDSVDANAAGQTPGSATWPCSYTDAVAESTGCPALDEVTAIRITVGDPNIAGDGLPTNEGQALDITWRGVGNSPLDTYNNAVRMREVFLRKPRRSGLE